MYIHICIFWQIPWSTWLGSIHIVHTIHIHSHRSVHIYNIIISKATNLCMLLTIQSFCSMESEDWDEHTRTQNKHARSTTLDLNVAVHVDREAVVKVFGQIEVCQCGCWWNIKVIYLITGKIWPELLNWSSHESKWTSMGTATTCNSSINTGSHNNTDLIPLI